MTRTRLLIAALLAPILAAGPSRADEAVLPPVLVELFTSQGCSSCPPADAVLDRLAGRADVVALALHVDYWDYLGWKDTFADPDFTRRQYRYRDRLGGRVVYTPQTIVQGGADAVGSNAAHIVDLVAIAQREHGGARIEFDATAGGVSGRLLPGPALTPCTVWVATYDRRREVGIERGENAGRRLVYRNVVRGLAPAGAWSGDVPQSVALPEPGEGQGIAVWLEADRTGAVLAAAKFER